MAVILVVEDDPSNAMLCTMVLQRAGHKVLNAVDGPGAMDEVHDWTPDALVLDVSLAGPFTGLDVCRALRAEPDTAGVGVLMVSGWAFDSDIAAAHEAGADGYLSKPFRPPDLTDALDAVLALAAARQRR
jgi:CheY-like chemotaxis protein